MSPLVVVGAAIVGNVILFTGSIVWSNRLVKRVAAERAAAYRAMFVLDPLPPAGEEVQLLIDDERDARGARRRTLA